MVKVPSNYRYSSTNADLIIDGYKVGSKKDNFTESKPLSIEKQDNNLFIQTDKPIYKPGQTSKKIWHT